MPHVELRQVDDGRKVCYAPHSHTHWSLGAITAGESTFHYRDDRYHIHAGNLVLMNPEWVHACNPIEDRPWAYQMLYVDADWLTQFRYAAGLLDTPHFQRTFKRLVAATPNQYRQPSLNQQVDAAGGE